MSGIALVVEDDPDIALAIRTVLRRGGYQLLCARDGAEGLRVFQAQRPDLVVLDIGLPLMDGWAVLERIRAVSDTPVLILTAHSLGSDELHKLESRADDYLTKPFENDELLERVNALARASRAHTEDRGGNDRIIGQ